MSRKSVLNPNATPYIPLSKKSSGMSFEGEYKVKLPQTTGGEAENTTDYQLPKAGDIQNADGAFDASSSMMAHKTMLDGTGTLPSEIEDDRDLIVQALLAMFPHVSIDFLTELLEVNNGDMSDTIDMLEQLEIEDDGPETSGFGSKLPKQRHSKFPDSTLIPYVLPCLKLKISSITVVSANPGDMRIYPIWLFCRNCGYATGKRSSSGSAHAIEFNGDGVNMVVFSSNLEPSPESLLLFNYSVD